MDNNDLKPLSPEALREAARHRLGRGDGYFRLEQSG